MEIIAGNCAVVEACDFFGFSFICPVTLAGKMTPAYFLFVEGVVLGLSVVGTDKIMGDIVTFFYTRSAVEEHAKILDANFKMTKIQHSSDVTGIYARGNVPGISRIPT